MAASYIKRSHRSNADNPQHDNPDGSFAGNTYPATLFRHSAGCCGRLIDCSTDFCRRRFLATDIASYREGIDM